MIRHPEGRAVTDADKRRAIDQLLAAWKRVPELRLGQLMVCALANRDLFALEDEVLADRIDRFVDGQVMRQRARS